MTSISKAANLFPALRFSLGLIAFIFLLNPAVVQSQQYEIQGKVINRTHNLPVANQQVDVVAVGEGMQTVKTLTTDEGGRFRLPLGDLKSEQVYLLHFFYDGVRYDTPLDLAGNREKEIEIEVFDKTNESGGAIRIGRAQVLLRAEGERMKIEQAFEVINAGTPPRVFSSAEGTFRVQVDSTSTTPPQISATAVMGLPIPQQADPTGRPNEYRIYYPMKPGATIVHVSYEVDYLAEKYDFRDRVWYPIDRLEVMLSPPDLEASSPLLASSGVDSANGIVSWSAEGVGAGISMDIRLSGAAAPAGSASPQEQVSAQAPAREPSAGDELVRTVPNAVDRYQVPLVLSIFLVLVAGAGFSLRKSRRDGPAA